MKYKVELDIEDQITVAEAIILLKKECYTKYSELKDVEDKLLKMIDLNGESDISEIENKLVELHNNQINNIILTWINDSEYHSGKEIKNQVKQFRENNEYNELIENFYMNYLIGPIYSIQRNKKYTLTSEEGMIIAYKLGVKK